MKLAFISMTTRVIIDEKGNYYLNSHMNREVLERYKSICDELRVVLRDSTLITTTERAQKEFNYIPKDICNTIVLYNPFYPITNLFNLNGYIEMKRKIEETVMWADRVILSSPVGIYSSVAIKSCKKHSKRYLIQCGAFYFETDWYHGLDGKIVAKKREINAKRNMLEAPFAMYVTSELLQKRYPCLGKTIGCSDVELPEIDDKVLDNRLTRIRKKDKRIVLGTAAKIDDKRKGQKNVLYAIYELKGMGYTNVEYQLVGQGSNVELTELAKKLGIDNKVRFVGPLAHDQIYEWLDRIDIYIQPSYSEGLCRAIIEAMSRGCPVICTDVGGNPELISREYLVEIDDIIKLVNKIIMISDTNEMIIQAKKNHCKAQEFNKNKLDKIRNDFLTEFMR